MHDALLLKLQKIKTLADSARDSNEGIAAMLMFQKLLSKNGLTECDVVVEIAPEKTIEISFMDGLRIEKWLHFLHIVIAEHFRCLPVSEIHPRVFGKNSHKVLKFIGHANDVSLALESYNTAKSVAERLFRERNKGVIENEKSYSVERKIKRSDYLIGFVRGLKAAYEEQESSSELGLITTIPEDVLKRGKEMSKKTIRLACDRANPDMTRHTAALTARYPGQSGCSRR